MDAAELAFAGIHRQAEALRAGDVSSRDLVAMYLERIDRFDGRLNAFRVVLVISDIDSSAGQEHAHGDIEVR